MVHMYYKRKWAGHLAAHVHHMRYWVALYVHKETRMAAVKRAEKSDLENVFKKVNTTIGGRGGESSAPRCHVQPLLYMDMEYEF